MNAGGAEGVFPPPPHIFDWGGGGGADAPPAPPVPTPMLDTKGEGVGGDTPSDGGDFLEIWVLNSVFFCAL